MNIVSFNGIFLIVYKTLLSYLLFLLKTFFALKPCQFSGKWLLWCLFIDIGKWVDATVDVLPWGNWCWKLLCLKLIWEKKPRRIALVRFKIRVPVNSVLYPGRVVICIHYDHFNSYWKSRLISASLATIDYYIWIWRTNLSRSVSVKKRKKTRRIH